MVRGTAEHVRGTQMVAGLGAFVEGASGLIQREDDTGFVGRHRASTTSRRTASSLQQAQSKKSFPFANTDTLPNGVTSSPKTQFGSPHKVPTAPASAPVAGTGDPAASDVSTPVATPPTEPTPSSISRSTRASRRAEDLRAEIVASNVRGTFQRAARLVQECLEVDGAIYLDATIGKYAGLVDSAQRRDSLDQASDPGTSATDNTSTEAEGSAGGDRLERDSESKSCAVIASCVQIEDDTTQIDSLNDKPVHLDVSEKLLGRLLRRYPRGKVWNFNEEGDASTDEESSEGGSTKQSSDDPTKASSQQPTNGVVTRKKQRKRARIDDAREIQRLFPGVRSLAIIGMWDQMRGRWFAGCTVWSYSPLRLLSNDFELNFLTAFNDVIMAEVHRLEAQNSSETKMDFISSISHELRSPLHGILGSVECLQEEPADSYTSGLTSQIEICGRTLLDIVDHLLDYSKINFFSKTKGGRSNSSQVRQRTLSAGRTSQLGGMMSLDIDISLDEVTEEVVDTAVYSFCCSKNKQEILDRKVTFILEIDRSLDLNWRCRLATGGWKRICMNLIGNALKYTDEGYIKVSLSAAAISNKRKRFNAVFTVTDTGRGMSKEFVENHLFKPFSQENSFMEGTGLGMSLVARIVEALGGKIEVRSEKGAGTTMTVTVPLERSDHSKDETAKAEQLRARQRLSGLTIGIIDTNGGETAPIATSLQLASLQKTCIELGLQTRTGTLANVEITDVILVTESDCRHLRQSHEERTTGSQDAYFRTGMLEDKPLIVLCDSIISARVVRASGVTDFTKRHVELIPQPGGPEHLAKAIRACLPRDLPSPQNGSNTVNTIDTSTEQRQLEPKAETQDFAAPTVLPFRAAQRPGLLKRSSSDSPVSPMTLWPQEPAQKTPVVLEQPKSQSQPSAQQGPRPLFEPTKSSAELEGAQAGTDEKKPNPQRPPISAEKRAPGLPILIVDDNAINLQLLVTYAKKNNHRKTTAQDGLQAVEKYKAACHGSALAQRNLSPIQGLEEHITLLEKPKVVLMDINMPVLSGFEATRQIRQFEHQQGLEPATIIALTGLGSAEAQQEAYSSGVDLFMMKPVRLKELTAILDRIPRA